MAKQEESQLHDMRHSLAHILAAAVKNLYKDVKFGVGPPIEDGFYYDFDLSHSISSEDFKQIEAQMKSIIKADIPFEKLELSQQKAREQLRGQPYKLELLEQIIKTGNTALEAEPEATKPPDKGEKITFFKIGDFIDLCRGGHVESTGKVGAFNINRVAGAYWRGSEKNPMLQRVYGIAYRTPEEVKKRLEQIEEAKKRDHRILGERLQIFTSSPEVGQGLILWLPKGTIIKDQLEKLGVTTERRYGYQRVSTPHIAKQELFHTSGHLPYFKDDMYPPMKMDNETYYLRPMNCPHHHLVYKAFPRSYRQLPMRLAEFGTVYRNEGSGTLMGLMRVRGMTQNDAHIYCTEEQVLDELVSVMEMHKFYYKLFDIKDYYVELALPDLKNKKDKYFDDKAGWDKATELLRQAAKQSAIEVVEKSGEAAFYGPKFDFNITSAVGREFGASTNQLDFGSAKRFGLTYADKDGKEKSVPYIVHRAPLGSDERFIGFLIEHYGGAFPIWLAPEQIRVITLNDDKKITDYGQDVYEKLSEQGVRAHLDTRNESVSKKIRDTEVEKVPYAVVIGEKEVSSGKFVPRVRKDIAVEHKEQAVNLEQLTQTIANENKSYVRHSSL